MHRYKSVVFLLAMFLMCGCSRVKVPFFGKNLSQDNPPKVPDQRSMTAIKFVDEGRVVDLEKLQTGQNLAISPFFPGVGVEFTNEFDRVSLMIVKGITDALGHDSSVNRLRFNFITADSTRPPDKIIKGRITGLTSPSTIKKWLPWGGRHSVEVFGKLVDARTGEVIVTFTDKELSRNKSEGQAEVGYRIGQNIGQFILSGLNRANL